jgi:PAT family acetyl-CoA transporter-like MFS transporter 1
MPSSSSKGPRKRSRRRSDESLRSSEDMSPRLHSSAVTSSLDHIQIVPRTPKMPRTLPTQNGMGDGSDEVELSLLGEAERREAAHGLEDGMGGSFEDWLDPKQPLSSKDKRAMALLIVLCSCFYFISNLSKPTCVGRPDSRSSGE